MLAEVLPIDDIRSTAEYRRRVAANLLEEFLTGLHNAGRDAMNPVLAAWNRASEAIAIEAMLACCGARRWAHVMVALRPFSSVEILSLSADQVWSTMQEPDWLEAFACHPRIGERQTAHATAQAAAWSQQEQASAANAKDQVSVNWPKAMLNMSGASALPTLCVQPERAPKRCSRYFSGA